MKDYNELFLESLVPNFRKDSVLSTPGIFPTKYKPLITYGMGKAWKKKEKNGSPYLKIRFDGFITSSGKTLYVEARPRKKQPDVYMLRILKADFPIEIRHPFPLTTDQPQT